MDRDSVGAPAPPRSSIRRAFVVAGLRLYREGIAQALGRDGGFRVTGTAADCASALRALGDHAPDLVLLDVTLPDSLATIAALSTLVPRPCVVAVGLPDTEQEVLAFAEAGIAGYVSSDDSVERLLEVLHSATRGELLCSPRIAAVMLRRLAALRRGPAGRASGPALTVRERQIVSLIDHGLSNKQIGSRLSIELATVKNHVHRILEKLQVHRRGEAVARVRQREMRDWPRGERRRPSGPVERP